MPSGTSSALADTTTSIQPTARVPRLIRWAWIVLATIALVLSVTGIPTRYAKVKSSDPDIRGAEFRNLIEVGASARLMAALDVAEGLLVSVPLFAAGTLLFARSKSRQAMMCSALLVLVAATYGLDVSAHRSTGPPLSQSPAGILATIVYFLASCAIFVTPFWLPQGYFTSRWARAYVALAFVILAGLYFLVDFPRSHDLVNAFGLTAIVFGVWAQLQHYRRADDDTVRQQIKWVMIGIVVTAVGFLVYNTTTLTIGRSPALGARLAVLFARLLLNACQIALPLCFAIAILRYRLWQVDLVINRSFVYAAVSLFLLIVFFGSAAAVQLAVNNAALAGAVSFAAAGLLFNPARQGVQRFVDKRLFGLRFNLIELGRAQAVPRLTPGLSGRMLGEYRVLEVVGRGGMGEVYRGEGGGRIVALKIIDRATGADPGMRKWMDREAQALGRLNHPNIVKFHGSGASDGVHYIALDFVAGRDLGAILNEQRRMTCLQIRPWLNDIASALDYAHHNGFVHRDIKPSNIMVKIHGDGTCQGVLLDFGIAKFRESVTGATGTGVIGTIQYMAPEQILAATIVDGRADVYALGVTVYQSLTGTLPFEGNAGQLVFSHLHQEAVNPRVLIPELSHKTAAAVIRALAKRPDDRFDSAGAFAAELADG